MLQRVFSNSLELLETSTVKRGGESVEIIRYDRKSMGKHIIYQYSGAMESGYCLIHEDRKWH